jgi:hypothetical protein
MKKASKNAELSRRLFLKRASIILGGAGLSPLLEAEMLNKLARYIVPVASAQSVTRAVDFYIDVPIRAAFCFGSMMPPPAFTAQINPEQGLIWPSNQVSTHPTGGGRNLFLTPGARSVPGSIGLESFAARIAHFECGEGFERSHEGIWGSRMGGRYKDANSTTLPDDAGASLAPLFANQVASRRGANNPLIPGAIMARGACEESYNGLPTLAPLDSIRTLSGFFKPRVAKIGRTEMNSVIDSLKRINALQETEDLRLRLLDVGNARLASAQGLDLIMADQVNVIEADYNSLLGKFKVGSTIGGGLGGPMDFGESLLLAFIGFKHNLVGSASIHLDVDHLHLRPEFDSQTAKDHVSYLSYRLGAMLDELSKTAHPFRAGANLLDHTMITLTSEGQRGVLFSNTDGSINWDDLERWGAVLMGGPVRGGYYGDVYANSNPTTDDRGTVGFDFNTGARGGSKPNPATVYRTMAELLSIPPAAIQAQMMGRYNTAVMNILKA